MTDAVRRIWRLADLSVPWALRVLVTLDVPDLIASGVDDTAGLARKTGAEASALASLLRHLAAHEVLAEPEPGRYALTEGGRALCAGHPSRLYDWLDLRGAGGRMDAVWSSLLPAVRTGRPVHADVHGAALWEDLHAHPELQRSFDHLMSQSSMDYDALVDAVDWSSARHVVDVGGGQGELLARIVAGRPHLTGTLVDQPGTVDTAPALLAAAGVGARCTVRAGDFLTDPLPRADTYVIAAVLHNWDDDRAASILGAIARAAAPGARVVVVERLVDRISDRSWATHVDLKMLLLLGGRERTGDEMHALAGRAGLDPVDVRRARRGWFALEYAVAPHRP